MQQMVGALRDHRIDVFLLAKCLPPCPRHGTLRNETLVLLFCEFCKMFARAISYPQNRFKVNGHTIGEKSVTDYLEAEIEACPRVVAELRNQRRSM